MKFTFRSTLALAICVVFFYTACKKVANAPVKIASEKDISSMIALNISKSLSGDYGGISLRDGIKPPSVILNSRTKKLVVNSISPLCGYTIDTSVIYKFRDKVDSISSIVRGRFTFTFTCTGDFPDGYKVSTDLKNTGRAPAYSFVYAIAQYYKVQALNPQYSQVSLDGSLRSFGDFKFGNHPGVDTNFAALPIFQHQLYILHELKIDIANNLDIISGSATFTSTGRNSFGTWDYSGTIEFIGNHKAIITINGHGYNADLITGVVTPI